MPVITCVEDLKRIYKRRTPRMFYDYAESGSWTEQTFRENTTDFQDIHLRQRVAIDMDGRTTKSQMIGQDVSMPVALAPVGLTGMQCADGEIKAARAAEKFGVPYTLSTMSICSIEDVAEHTSAPFWFQLYVMRQREISYGLVERAANRRHLAVLGRRRRDDVGPRLGSRHGLNAEIADGQVVVDGVTLEDAAMPVRGVLAEADIGNHHHLRRSSCRTGNP